MWLMIEVELKKFGAVVCQFIFSWHLRFCCFSILIPIHGPVLFLKN